jgi:hypothetical protein
MDTRCGELLCLQTRRRLFCEGDTNQEASRYKARIAYKAPKVCPFYELFFPSPSAHCGAPLWSVFGPPVSYLIGTVLITLFPSLNSRTGPLPVFPPIT